MSKINYNQATFLTSAAKTSQLPPDEGYEVAFVGRSNVGKSTALNVLTNNKKLARTSKTPGRTQLINLFEMDDERRLVDLPGYGYAKVPTKVKQAWQETLSEYLRTRESLRGLVLLIDIRHPLKSVDLQMLEWTMTNEIPCHILLTKADKLKRGAAKNTLLQVKKDLGSLYKADVNVSVQLFSGTDKQGLDTLCHQLDTWFS